MMGINLSIWTPDRNKFNLPSSLFLKWSADQRLWPTSAYSIVHLITGPRCVPWGHSAFVQYVHEVYIDLHFLEVCQAWRNITFWTFGIILTESYLVYHVIVMSQSYQNLLWIGVFTKGFKLMVRQVNCFDQLCLLDILHSKQQKEV